MRKIAVKLSNGYKYELTGGVFRYKVYCIGPEGKEGYLKSKETDCYLPNGTKVYRTLSYWFLRWAIYAMHEHAGLNKTYSGGHDSF